MFWSPGSCRAGKSREFFPFLKYVHSRSEVTKDNSFSSVKSEEGSFHEFS